MPIAYILFLFLFIITACQAIEAAPRQAIEQRLADKTSEQRVQHYKGKVRLDIAVPEGWESYNTEAGIVLNEFMGSGTPDQPLKGFLIHIFVPYLDDFRAPLGDENMAWYVLMQVVRNPAYVGDAIVSDPVAFEWDHFDAAYYLLNNQDGTITILLALALPDHSNMVVSHVSLPVEQSSRIPALLPDLLSSFAIDGMMLDATILGQLFENLEFPVAG